MQDVVSNPAPSAYQLPSWVGESGSDDPSTCSNRGSMKGSLKI